MVKLRAEAEQKKVRDNPRKKVKAEAEQRKGRENPRKKVKAEAEQGKIRENPRKDRRRLTGAERVSSNCLFSTLLTPFLYDLRYDFSNGHEETTVVNDEGGNKNVGPTEDEEEEDKVDVFKHGIVPLPQDPYFVAKLRRKRRSELVRFTPALDGFSHSSLTMIKTIRRILFYFGIRELITTKLQYIPMEVINDHKLRLPATITLVDDRGREWSSKIKVWKDGRTWISRGWKAFCRWNHLLDEDRCICEFKRDSDQLQLYIRVTILRAGSWLPRNEDQP
ncbi:hypothetical protein NMG60_11019668 [Bertholletia excelsa]